MTLLYDKSGKKRHVNIRYIKIVSPRIFCNYVKKDMEYRMNVILNTWMGSFFPGKGEFLP